MSEQDQYWMQQALLLADQAQSLGEVPVGALLVLNGEVIGRGYNQPITTSDPTAHAEIVALRDAAKYLGNYRLVGATLYVTIEPCTMCAGAIIHSRISRLVYGATEPKGGAISSCSRLLEADYVNHKVDYLGGVCADECSQKIANFFLARRRQRKNK